MRNFVVGSVVRQLLVDVGCYFVQGLELLLVHVEVFFELVGFELQCLDFLLNGIEKLLN
jgi:hypothetical protein